MARLKHREEEAREGEGEGKGEERKTEELGYCGRVAKELVLEVTAESML